MKIVKSIFSDFTNSLIPQPSFYSKILKRKFSSSLLYFITLIFCLNLLFSVLYIEQTNLKNLGKLKDSFISTLYNFPSDLKIIIRKGVMITTYDRPYFLWMNYDNKKILVFVVDQTATAKDFENYNPLALLTENALILKDRSIALAKTDLTIDKNFTYKFIATLQKLYPLFVLGFFAVIFLIAPLFISVYIFIYILIAGFISYLVYNLIDRKHNHKKTLQLALHASTLPIVVFYVIRYINPQAIQLGVATFILILIFTLCALHEAYLNHK